MLGSIYRNGSKGWSLMDQPVRHFTEEDLERIVCRDYPLEQRQQAHEILTACSASRTGEETLRIRMDCLKLAGGSFEKLKNCADLAETEQVAWGHGIRGRVATAALRSFYGAGTKGRAFHNLVVCLPEGKGRGSRLGSFRTPRSYQPPPPASRVSRGTRKRRFSEQG